MTTFIVTMCLQSGGDVGHVRLSDTKKVEVGTDKAFRVEKVYVLSENHLVLADNM